jgi:hypothetical protein
VLKLVPMFAKGEHCRILHVVAPVFRQQPGLASAVRGLRGPADGAIEEFQQVFRLHDAMLDRARAAVNCWSIAGRRHGVVKDMRVMIAKMAWAEPWLWGEADEKSNMV